MVDKAKYQKRGQLVTEMRALQEAADKEKRPLSAEEQKRWDEIDAEQERLGQEIKSEDEAEQRRLKLTALEDQLSRSDHDTRLRPEPAAGAVAGQPAPAGAAPDARAKTHLAITRAYLLDGMEGVRAMLAQPEHRALQSDVFISGGSLVAPQTVVAGLIKAVDDAVFVRKYAHKETVTEAASLGVATLDADPADADWTSEIKTGSEDSTMATGKRELSPHPLAKRIKIAEKLLRLVPAAEGLVTGRLAYKFGITEEKGFLTGSGAQQPLGIFTASDNGVPTSRDVSTGNTETSMTFDGLIEAKHTLKGSYWPSARGIFHRDGVKQIRKLKDGNGQYLWQPGLVGGIPDRILELPYDVSEYAPNTFTTGLYVGAFWAPEFYWIVDALQLRIQKLVELYAETNQVGFIGRAEVDGQPVLAEAFVRVKLA